MKRTNAACCLLFASVMLSASANAATYKATDLGVKADGTTNNATTLQKIIDTCSREGGGTVVIDKGTVVSGMLYLKDNVTLKIAEGAALKCTSNRADYPYVPVDFDTYYPERRTLIYAQNQQNIAVVGAGKIDGNRPAFPNGSESDRVSLIRFDGCKDVSITGVTLFEASMWTTHIYRCDRVEIADLTIDNARGIRVLNDDGINIDGSSNVRIKNCIINTRDDCITMKNTSRQGCKNVEIDNCTLATKKSGLKFGTESFTGFENITARNLDISGNPGLRDAIALLTVDGAYMKNILIENVNVRDAECAIFIRLGSRMRTIKSEMEKHPDRKYDAGSIDGVTIRNVAAKTENLPSRAILIAGLEGYRIKNVTLENVDIELRTESKDIRGLGHGTGENDKGYPASTMFGPLSSWGIFVRHAENVMLKNVTLTSRNGLPLEQMAYADDVEGLVTDDEDITKSIAEFQEWPLHIGEVSVSPTYSYKDGDFDKAFPPETKPEDVPWHSVGLDENGYVDFAKVFENEKPLNCINYVRVKLVSDKDCGLILQPRVDEGLRVFVNGKRVHDSDGTKRASAPHMDRTILELRKGRAATVLFGITQGSNRHAARHRLGIEASKIGTANVAVVDPK